ncbi:hypothetical protein F5141DRAFT_256678 [Pisolithus sp. B1]|nr:hypothetical protein F5141DRAFT_256678 [Pisolithus sp. B1]
MRTREERAADQLKSHIQGVREVIVNLTTNRQYVFLDTPGFDDTYLSDKDILRMIAEWLEKEYPGKTKLNGIIYAQCITDDRMSGSVCENLHMFARLCGDKAAGGVRLMTTMWDKARNKDVAESRVSQLEYNFWKPLIDAGARHKRFEDNSSKCAWDIIEDLVEGGNALLDREELIERLLYEKTTGQPLYSPLQKLLHELGDMTKLLQEEAGSQQRDPELVRQPKAEQCGLEEVYDELDEPEIPLSRRITLLCLKNTPSSSAITAQLEDQFVAENDYVIFVVGPAGVEKTWFTRQLCKNHDKGRHLHTEHVAAWRCNLGTGSDIIIVDAPSFRSGRHRSNAEKRMTSWLESKFTQKCHSAILFLHSLDSHPTSVDMSISWHLETFAKAFRNEFAAPSDIYVVPTCNLVSALPSETLIQRLSQLKTVTERLNGYGECDWHASIFPGVFKGLPETAWSAVLLLLKNIAQARCIPPKSPDTFSALKDLADILFKEFTSKESDLDLDAIITLGQTALEFTSPEHPQHLSVLIGLAGLLSERFSKGGRIEDLDESITLKCTAAEYMSPEEPQRQTILLELDGYLSKRFRQTDSAADLEKIITVRRAALEHTTQPNRCRALLDLANALHEQFQKQGTENSIAEALSLVRAALGLCPPGHPDHALPRDRLASYLQTKVGKKATLAHVKGPGIGPSSASSYDIKRSIKKAVSDKVEKIPLRLLHTPTGVLCNRDGQISRFEGSPQYKQLQSLASSLDKQQLDAEINNVISEYFGFATLSHRWGSGEPLLRDVEGKSVYDLGSTDGEEKLQMFCALALQRNFQWAWSDTCCIDKDSSAELQEAIGTMFSWYRWSSLTIVHLPDVFDAGSLASSVWFTRGWTLQELLASHAILFFTCDWSLYSKSDALDHKTDPALLEELQNATGIAKLHLRNFYPGMDDARSRLHWASVRRTTRPEDIAYSLFGIFQVHLPIFYGESAQNALGRLLAEIVSRSGDVSVLDWVGKRSSFNSCFPTDLAPYQIVPRFQLIPSDPAGRNNLDPKKAQQLYNKLARLPRAGFVNSKLTLPSTVHPVTEVKPQGSWPGPSRYGYAIRASRLRPLNVALSVELDESVDSYILVRPWHPKCLEQQTNRGVEVVWKLLEILEQPFNALLLKRSLHNEYTRIACCCTITARTRDLDSVLDSEVLIPEIV